MKRRSIGRDGCFTIIWMCLVTSLFLVINGAIVAGIYVLITPEDPGLRRLVQIALYLGPVILIFPEWWIIDLILDRRRR